MFEAHIWACATAESDFIAQLSREWISGELKIWTILYRCYLNATFWFLRHTNVRWNFFQKVSFVVFLPVWRLLLHNYTHDDDISRITNFPFGGLGSKITNEICLWCKNGTKIPTQEVCISPFSWPLSAFLFPRGVIFNLTFKNIHNFPKHVEVKSFAHWQNSAHCSQSNQRQQAQESEY